MQSKQRQSNWRKRYLPGSDRNKAKLIGKPVLVETTLHGDFLDKLPNVRDFHTVSGPTIKFYGPSGIEHEKYMKELPPLSFQMDDDLEKSPRPVSEVPTASSIYTKPSPRLSAYEFDPEYQVAPLFAGRSMPSSRSRSEGSPQHLHVFDSNPTLRPPFTHVTGNVGRGDLGIDTSFARAPWQGASGQIDPLSTIASTTETNSKDGLVSPMEDLLQADSFTSHPPDAYRPLESAGRSVTETPGSQPLFNSTPPNRNDSSTAPPHHPQTPPVVSRFSWTTHATSAEAPRTVAPSTPDSRPSPGNLTNTSPPAYNSRTRQYQQSPTPASALRDEVRPYLSAARVARTPETTPPQTSSTIALSPQSGLETGPRPQTSIMDRPRPFSAIPQEFQQADKSPPPPASNALMRIKRKPAPSAAAPSTRSRYDSPASRRSASAGDKEKSLPTDPNTLSSIDHITLLQAQLATLALRKHNLLKVVTSLTTVFGPNCISSTYHPATAISANDYANGYAPPVPALGPAPNPVVLDLAKRRETRDRVERLERDLADVKREEHELGLLLMRAQRRRDQEIPSALWVRRVTSVSDEL